MKSTSRLPFTKRKDNGQRKSISKLTEIIEDQNLCNEKTSNSSISKDNNALMINDTTYPDFHIKIKRPRAEKSYNNLINQYCKPTKLELIKNIKGYRTDGLIGVKRRELLKILTSKVTI